NNPAQTGVVTLYPAPRGGGRRRFSSLSFPKASVPIANRYAISDFPELNRCYFSVFRANALDAALKNCNCLD
ncbi:hypothetical protein HHI36_011503, partial [Cryptolaemus montrouzieri]